MSDEFVFYCWQEGDSLTDENATQVTVDWDDVEDAAKAFAAEFTAMGSGEVKAVVVRDQDGRLHKVTVSAYYEVHYEVCEVEDLDLLFTVTA